MNRFVNLVEVISEGEIEGLVNGANSIYLDQTPLLNPNGTKNFTGVSFDLHPGSAGQSYFTSNPTAENATAVGALLLAAQAPVVRTITDPNATYVRLLFTVPQLSSSGPGGDAGWQVDWAIDLMPSGGAWSQVGSGSTGYAFFSTPQTFQTVITLPASGYPWSIRVRRTTGDPGLYPVFDGQKFVNYSFFGDLNWESFTSVVSAKLSYPNTAACALVIDANAYGQSSLPTRSYKVRGLKVDVPVNYNPTTRAYTGVWNGAFKKAWTNNPAWILRDLLINDRYGLGEFLTDAMVDKWALYQIAQYCDQSVPDGYGGSEPRYTLNCQITSKTEAFKLIQSIAAVFRGMAFWSINSVYATADMPSDPVKLYSNANVINGEFNYSGTAIKARHSVALVTWYDPTDFHRPAVEVVIDDAMLKKFGWRELNLEAMGCTTRSLANRYGRWALDTEKNASESVEFVAGWDTADVNPGDIIAIADAHKAMVRAGGRLAAVDGTTLTLDAAFTPTAGQSYQLMVELPNGAVGTRAISSFSGANVVIASAYTMVSDAGATVTASPLVGAVWTITGSDIAPRQFRVMSREEREPHLFHISAILHDPTKYARIEQGVVFDQIPYFRPAATIQPPSNLAFQESLFQQDGKAQTKLTLSWTPGADFLSTRYQIKAVTPTTTRDLGQIAQTTLTLDNPESGDWTFEIYAISADGVMSETITGQIAVQGWAAVAGPSVSHLEVHGGGAAFSGQDCKIVWTNNFPATSYDYGNEPTGAGGGTTNPFYKDNIVRVYDAPTNTLLRTDVVFTESYTYTFANNTADYKTFGKNPQRNFRFEVSVRDTLGRESEPVKLVAENPTPALVIPTVSVSLTSIFVTFTPPTDSDYSGCIVWLETNDSFDPLTTTPVYDGPSNALSFPAEPKTTYYVRLACYDAFDKNNLNISPPVSVYMTGIVVDTTPPATPTGLTLATATTTKSDGGLDYALTADWADSPSENFAYFDVALAEDAPEPVFISYQTTTSIYRWGGLKPNQSYRVKVRAWSKNGFESTYCAEQLLATAAKATPPGAPTGLTISASLRSVFLSWANPSDPDLAGVEIWRSATNALASAAKIGVTLGSGFTDTGLTTGATYFYWIRAFNTSGVYAAYTGPVSIAPGTLATIDVGPSVITTTHLSDLAVNAAKIADNAVVTAKIADAAIAAGKIAAAAVGATHIADQAVNAAKIATAAVETTKIADGAVATAKIAAAAVGEAQIANLAVSSAKVADAAISTAKIAAAAVDAGKIALGAVGSTQLADLAVTSAKVADNAVTTAKIAAAAVDAGKIAALAVDSTKIADNAVTTAKVAAAAIDAGKIAAAAVDSTKIADNAVTTAKIVAGAVDAGKIAANAVGSAQLADLAVNAAKIADAAVTTGKIAAAAVDTSKIADLSINTAKLADAAISTAKIAAGAVASGKIAANAVGSNEIAAGSVVAGKIAANAVSATEIAAGSITSAKIAAGAVTATEIAADAITSTKLAAGAVTAGKIAANSVTSAEIAAGSIISSKIAAGAVTATQIAAESIAASNIAASAITSDKIAAGAITSAKIYAGAVTANELAAGAVTAGKIAADAVTATQIAAGAVTAGKIAADAVTATEIAANAITAAELAAGAVTAGKIAANAVTATELAAGAVTAGKIAADAVTATEIAANAITAAELAAGAVTAGKIAANAVTATEIASNAITTIKIAADAITSDKIAATSITTAKIAANAVTATEIAAGAIVSAKIAAGAVTATEIAANAVTTAKIAAGAVTANEIGANSITSAKIAAGAVTAGAIAAGAITAGKIAAGAVTATEIATGSITSGKIAAGVVTATEIAASAITSAKIAADAVTASQISAGAVTTGKIAAGAVTATEIAAGSIVAGKIAAGVVTATELASGSVTADKIVAGSITASKLTVRGPSIFTDSFFDDAAIWTPDSGGWFYENATPSNTTHTIGLRRSAILWQGTYSGTARRHIWSGFQKGLTAGQVLTLRARGYNSDTIQNVYIDIQFYNNAATYIGGGGVIFAPNTTTAATRETQITVPVNCYFYQLVVYNQAPGSSAWNGVAAIGDLQLVIAATGGMIVDGAIVAAKIAAGTITADHIATGAITATQIALNTISGDRLVSATISGDKLASATVSGDKIASNTIGGDRLVSTTSLPATITVGASGIKIGQLTDPATLVNSNATTIQPGKVLIAGSSTLASWLNGGDNTKIDGGAIAANTISTNKLLIGARGVTVEGIEFSASGNTLYWTAGKISYYNEAGGITVVNISAGNAGWSSGTVYVGWYRDKTVLDAWTTAALNYDNWISMATYRGGTDYIINYGRTIIDGAKILTGTIGANQIAAGAIQTDKLAANAVTAAKIGAGEVTSDKIYAGAITTAKLATNAVTANEIASNAITSDKIAANAITAGKIAVGAVSASSISVTALSAFTANLGTVTTGLMQSADGKFIVDLTNKTITISD